MNFEIFISQFFFEYSKSVCIFLRNFLFVEKNKYENYKTFTNNIISVKNAKVLKKM
jgi:hypothetical protein